MIFVSLPGEFFAYHADLLTGDAIKITGDVIFLPAHVINDAPPVEFRSGYVKQMAYPVNEFAGLMKISHAMLNRRQGMLGLWHGLRK